MLQRLGQGMSPGKKRQGVTYNPDWSTWDGTNDGALETDVVGSDEWNTGQYAEIAGDNDTMLHFYVRRDTVSGDYALYSAPVTVNAEAKTLTLGDQNEIRDTGSAFGIPSIIKMSDTRYLAHQTVNATNITTFWILDAGGEVVATQDHPTEPLVNGGYDMMVRHSDTVAVIAFRHRSDQDGFVMAIDISGDSIAFGTAVEFADAITMGQPGLAALSATRGLVAHDKTLFRYTLSGTAITIGTSFDYRTGTVGSTRNATLTVIDTNTVLGTYQATGSTVRMYVASDDGSTQSVDIANTTLANGITWVSHEPIIEVQPYISGEQDGYYIMGLQSWDNYPDGEAHLIKYTGSAISVEQSVSISPDATAEHITVAQFPNGAVVYHYQDTSAWDWKVLTP